MKFSKHIFSRFFLPLLILVLGNISCKDLKENPVLPNNKVDFSKDISITNTNTKSDLGVLMRIALLKVDFAAYGTKNEAGILTKVQAAIITNPVNETWITVAFDGKYPKEIRSYNNTIIELKNYNRTNLTVDLTIKNTDGKVTKTVTAQKLTDDIFVGFEAAYRGLALSNARIGLDTKTNCQAAKETAATIGLISNALNCLIGLATIAESAGIALLLNGLGTAASCYNAFQGAVAKFNPQGMQFPSLSCSQNLVFDGYSIAGLLAGSGSITNVALTAASAALTSAATTADAAGCFDCPDDPPKPKAKSSGDPHISTHDGDDIGFQGHGEFIAVKSTTDNFEIQARQEPFAAGSKATTNTAVAIKTTANDVICVTLNPKTVYVNKVALPSAFGTKTLSDGSTITQTNSSIRLDTKQGDIVVVERYVDAWLDYSVSLPAARIGKVKGLMGNFDGILVNDIALNDGRVIEPIFANLYPTYADSWRITQANSLFVYDAGKTTVNYTNRNFPATDVQLTTAQIDAASKTCRAAGVTNQPYLNNCIYDVAVSGNSAFVASALNAQNFVYTGNISGGVVNSDVSYFQNIRLEVTNQLQSDEMQLNLLDWRTGKTYTLKDGAANADKIDIVGLAVAGNVTLYTPGSLKFCGISCGVSAINQVLDKQKWATIRKGAVALKTSIAKEVPSDPGFIPLSKWSTIKSAADIKSLHTSINLDPNESLTYTYIVDADNGGNSPVSPYANSVFRFVTQEGKKGAFIISGFGKIGTSDKYFVTLDIKIEK
jgi:von Willebrand factor type D domain